MEDAVEKLGQTEQLKKRVLGWKERANAKVGEAMEAIMEELKKHVVTDAVAEADR